MVVLLAVGAHGLSRERGHFSLYQGHVRQGQQAGVVCWKAGISQMEKGHPEGEEQPKVSTSYLGEMLL